MVKNPDIIEKWHKLVVEKNNVLSDLVQILVERRTVEKLITANKKQKIRVFFEEKESVQNEVILLQNLVNEQEHIANKFGIVSISNVKSNDPYLIPSEALEICAICLMANINTYELLLDSDRELVAMLNQVHGKTEKAARNFAGFLSYKTFSCYKTSIIIEEFFC